VEKLIFRPTKNCCDDRCLSCFAFTTEKLNGQWANHHRTGE
jgi:hypothetical protein